jgi:hypothetical protein
MAFLVFLLSSIVGAPQVQVEMLDSSTLSGELRELSPQSIVVESDGQRRALEPRQVLQLHFPSTAATADAGGKLLIDLADGSQMRAAAFTSHGDEAKLVLASGEELVLSRPTIAAVRAVEAADADQRQWTQIASGRPTGDVIVVRKKDALDYLEGVLHDVTGEQVEFEVDGEVLPVKWNKVFGFIFYRRQEPQRPVPQCQVFDVAGSRFAAGGVSLDGNRLHVELAGGGTVALPLARLRRLDYSQGKIVYLSDIDWDPRQSQRTALFGPPMPIDLALDLFVPQRDRALDGGELLLDKKAYAKGLALHSRTQLVFRLPEGFRRFTALAGIDDRTQRRGNVRLTIDADDKRLLEATIAGGDKPLPIDLNVEGASRLTILVDFGADQDVSDHLDLCEAKLSK